MNWNGGSTIGLTLVHDENQLHEALDKAILESGNILIEEYIKGPEYTVGILADQVLPILEVRAANSFYDYEAKYLQDDTVYLFDTGLSENQISDMQNTALKCFKQLRCRDIARIDFIIGPDNVAYPLEVNTLPGFTDHSLVPKAAGRIGLTMPQICDKIVQIAWDRPI